MALPGVETLLALGQTLGRGRALLRGLRQPRQIADQRVVQLREAGLITFQMRLGVTEFATHTAKLGLLARTRLLGEANGLLQPGDLGTHGVEASLHGIELVGGIGEGIAMRLNLGLDRALLRASRLQCHLVLTEHALALADVAVEIAPAQGRELVLQTPLVGLQRAVFLGRGGLALQVLKLFANLLAQVVQTLQVLARVAHTGFGLAPAFLVLGDAGRFFDEQPQLVRLGLDEARDHALLNDGVTARTQAGAKEQVLDVAAPAARTVEEVGRLTVAGHLALDRDLIEGRKLSSSPAVGVIEGQLDAGHADRLAAGTAVKDDVGHGLAAQHLGRTLAHDPAHRVDDIGLAAAVRPDDTGQIAWEGHGGGVHEGLETGEFDFFEPHRGKILKPISTNKHGVSDPLVDPCSMSLAKRTRARDPGGLLDFYVLAVPASDDPRLAPSRRHQP